MKENPKVLYDHIKKHKDRDTKIGPFQIDKELIYDTKEICTLLIKQYNSQFSKKCQSVKINEEEIYDTKEGDLSDIVFNEDDIADAINKLKKNSAAGPDGIPAILLINTRESIKIPLQIILRKSLDEGEIHDMFKLAYVTPIYKGGSKMNPRSPGILCQFAHPLLVPHIHHCNVVVAEIVCFYQIQSHVDLVLLVLAFQDV